MRDREYVAYGIYEGQGLNKEINITKTDGMARSVIIEEDGEFIIRHSGDVTDDNEPVYEIKIHPADFYDFVEMINEAAILHQERKCHWDNSLCHNKFFCNSCGNSIKAE